MIKTGECWVMWLTLVGKVNGYTISAAAAAQAALTGESLPVKVPRKDDAGKPCSGRQMWSGSILKVGQGAVDPGINSSRMWTVIRCFGPARKQIEVFPIENYIRFWRVGDVAIPTLNSARLFSISWQLSYWCIIRIVRSGRPFLCRWASARRW